MSGDVVEVILMWGEGTAGAVLATKYLREGERFVVGEEDGCDALIPAETLGERRASLVVFEPGSPMMLPPPAALAWVDGTPVACAPIRLTSDDVAEIALGDFTLRARLVPDERYVSPFVDEIHAADYGGFALSVLVHVGVLAALALFLPPLGATDDDGIARDQILTMRHLIDASAEREEEAKLEAAEQAAEAPQDHGASGGGRAVGAEGHMGTEHAPRDAGRWSAAGDAPRDLASLSRDQKQALAKDYSVIAMLNSLTSDPNAPSVPWGDVLRGADHESHMGALFGAEPAESWGIGGIGVSGAEEGGGGNNLGIGVNDIGGLSASLDRRRGSGEPGGIGGCPAGHSCGRVVGTHHVGAGLRMPREIATNGRLPADVILRIVRQNDGRFRACYEAALRTNPSLEGRVAVQFVIGRDGAVSVARDGDSDLPDMGVRNCIVKSFYSLSFPEPQGGTVNVTYPLALTAQ